MSDCDGCKARESEIQFLRNWIERLTAKPEANTAPLEKPYIGLPDGSVEYLEDEAAIDGNVES